jgi:hypothetical protein
MAYHPDIAGGLISSRVIKDGGRGWTAAGGGGGRRVGVLGMHRVVGDTHGVHLHPLRLPCGGESPNYATQHFSTDVFDQGSRGSQALFLFITVWQGGAKSAE